MTDLRARLAEVLPEVRGNLFAPESPAFKMAEILCDPALDRALEDAERYRLLRDVGPPDAQGYPTILQWKLVTQERDSGRLLFGADLDAAIDDARGK